jgi:hypothetical protein
MSARRSETASADGFVKVASPLNCMMRILLSLKWVPPRHYQWLPPNEVAVGWQRAQAELSAGTIRAPLLGARQ